MNSRPEPSIQLSPLSQVRLAVDCMGGDHGPSVTLPASQAFLQRHPDTHLVLVGTQQALEPARTWPRTTLVEATEVVTMDDPVEVALRRKRDSSMRVAISQVKPNEAGARVADACVSAGNTGALMAIARLVLRPMPGIERPALAAQWPTLDGSCIVLDVGSNIGATARQLVDYAVMGAGMARAHFGVERPKVGLLNVGSEEIKGNEEVKQAHAWLKRSDLGLPLEYCGFCEGDQIGQGKLDVIVVEGFAGNIALKTAEGTARQIGAYLKSSMTHSAVTKLGALLAKKGFEILKKKMDPRRVNGGPFLGLNGIAIKSHGGTDAVGFASAIDLGYEMADSGFVARLAADITALAGRLDLPSKGTGAAAAPPKAGGPDETKT